MTEPPVDPADLAEQQTPVEPDEGEPGKAEDIAVPAEADPADAAEQQRPVPVDDDR